MKYVAVVPPVALVLPATVSFDTVYLAVVVLVTVFTPSPPVRGSIEPRRAGSVTKSIKSAPMAATTKFVATVAVTSNELKVVVPPGVTVLGEPSPDSGSGKVEYWAVSGLKHANVCVTSSAPASVSLNHTIVNPDAKARSAATSTERRRRMKSPIVGLERGEPAPPSAHWHVVATPGRAAVSHLLSRHRSVITEIAAPRENAPPTSSRRCVVACVSLPEECQRVVVDDRHGAGAVGDGGTDRVAEHDVKRLRPLD